MLFRRFYAKLLETFGFDRGRVRRRFDERFTASRMASDYVKAYKSILTDVSERRLLRLVANADCDAAAV